MDFATVSVTIYKIKYNKKIKFARKFCETKRRTYSCCLSVLVIKILKNIFYKENGGHHLLVCRFLKRCSPSLFLSFIA